MDLSKIDLNLLLVFNQLMIERRVSPAAEALGVTQPAISNALRRLRQLLNDDLFLRTARGMEPTPFAEQLAEPIAYALDTINDALSQQQSFDPGKSDRTFILGLTDIGEIYFMPRLLPKLQELAPGIRLQTIRPSEEESLKDQMERGLIHATIGLLPQLQGGFFRQRLLRQGWACVLSQEHPLARKKAITLAEFSAARHVVVASTGTGHSAINKLMERKGIERNVQLTVPHFVALGHILHKSKLIATLPQRLAAQLEKPFGLKTMTHPVKLPEHTIDLFWHAKLHRDPANQWLRRLIFDLFAE